MKTILLINRNTEHLVTLSRLLGGKGGHRVIAKSGGSSALSVMREGTNIDAVVTDYILPDMDALNFMTSLKRIAGDQPPVIFLSDRVDISDYLTGLSLGAFEFLFMPVQPAEFLRIVRMATQTSVNKREAGQVDREGPGNPIPRVSRTFFKL